MRRRYTECERNRLPGDRQSVSTFGATPGTDGDKVSSSHAADTESGKSAPTERVAEGKPIVADDTVLRTLDETTRAVYECIPAEGEISIDTVRVDGVSVGKISGCMTKLEIKQLIQLLPGGRVKRMPLPGRKDS